MRQMVEMVGKTFGNLTVIRRVESRILPSGQHKTMWECKCSCGNTYIAEGYNLRNGVSRQCSKCSRKASAEKRKIHGLSDSRLQHIHSGMMARCTNKNHTYYKNYGGRGISVCDEWYGSKGFPAFVEWAKSSGYSDCLTLDRIDNNGNYCPENCKWSTRKEQANNTRRNKVICFNGETHTLSQWADIYHMDQDLLGRRLLRGVSMERAVMT